MINSVKVKRPAETKKPGVSGWVDLRIFIDSRGVVTAAQVLNSTNHLFDGPAIRAVVKYRYSPAKKDGQPVSFEMPISFEFAPWVETEAERKKKANKALEPTPTSVMPRADARVMPAAVVAHL